MTALLGATTADALAAITNARPGLHAAFAAAKALGTASAAATLVAVEAAVQLAPGGGPEMELTKEANTAATAEVMALFHDRRDQLFFAGGATATQWLTTGLHMDDTAFQMLINLRAGLAPSPQRGKCGHCGTLIATDADARHHILNCSGVKGCRTGQHHRVNDALCAALSGLRNITGGPALRVIREPTLLNHGFVPRPESDAAIRGQAAALMHIPVRGDALVARADAMPGVDAHGASWTSCARAWGRGAHPSPTHTRCAHPLRVPQCAGDGHQERQRVARHVQEVERWLRWGGAEPRAHRTPAASRPTQLPGTPHRHPPTPAARRRRPGRHGAWHPAVPRPCQPLMSRRLVHQGGAEGEGGHGNGAHHPADSDRVRGSRWRNHPRCGLAPQPRSAACLASANSESMQLTLHCRSKRVAGARHGRRRPTAPGQPVGDASGGGIVFRPLHAPRAMRACATPHGT